MRLLVVDTTSEGQTELVRRVQSIGSLDRDSLDLTVGLATPATFADRAAEVDVLLFGPGAADDFNTLAALAHQNNPTIELMVYVSDNDYRAGAFRLAQGNRARKVLPLSSTAFDLLQELTLINDELRVRGKVARGLLTVILQPKGGLGVTTIAAALADAAAEMRRHSLLWDLDIETRDLTRAFLASGPQSSVVRGWVDGSVDLTRRSMREALHPISTDIQLLPPPDTLAAGLDFAGLPESVDLAIRILHTARTMFHNIIVDTAGRLGPATGALLQEADVVLFAVDDSSLGLSAAAALWDGLRPVLQKARNIRFIRCGTKLPAHEIAATMFPDVPFDALAWSLPAIPFDPQAQRWAGSGKSLLQRGARGTRRVFEEIAREIGVASPAVGAVAHTPIQSTESPLSLVDHVRLTPADTVRVANG